ncbi:hypothetical protein ACFSHR_05640 [Azotobacter chroococcum]
MRFKLIGSARSHSSASIDPLIAALRAPASDMARYLDAQHQKATAENDKPHDRAIRKAG